jgi:pimeloyl-ACP methyl ester carboxylesterase
VEVQIETNGVTLDVQVEGDGRPVVLIHGFPDTKRLWSKVTPALVDAGYQVIVPDMRGYGASSKPADVDAYSLPMLAIDIVGILDHLSLERAHVVGHDWGAATAWGVGTFAPDRVDHLVAMSVGHPSAFSSAGMAQREKSWYMLLFQYTGLAEDWLRRDNWANFREWSNHPDVDAIIAELEANDSLTPGLNYYRATLTPEALTGPGLEFPPIQSPTMGVWSTGDFALLEEQMTGSAKFVANTYRYERVDGAGHWMQWEKPDAVSSLLIDFLPR